MNKLNLSIVIAGLAIMLGQLGQPLVEDWVNKRNEMSDFLAVVELEGRRSEEYLLPILGATSKTLTACAYERTGCVGSSGRSTKEMMSCIMKNC